MGNFMTREPVVLDAVSLLVAWWKYTRARDLMGLGLPVECPSTAGYKASRQYDDINGAHETDSRGELLRHVGSLVDGIAEPYRTALYVLARNRSTGVSVWISPRLPADKDEVAEITAEALARFADLI